MEFSVARGMAYPYMENFDPNDHPLVVKAKRLELETRLKGQPSGVLGHVAIELLQYLVNLQHVSGRWCVPTYDVMCNDIARSKSAVSRALKALKAEGFIEH